MDTGAAATTDDDGSSMPEQQLVRSTWARYEYGRDRGHNAYCRWARRLEDYYLGGGSQWSAEDKAILEEQGRLPTEFNEILPGVNAAIGYQIANRMDISFEPRGGLANQGTANTLNKVVMQIADNIKLHWKETEVFSDGLIQQRGYYEIRINFNDSFKGEVGVDVLDPMDVIPDPDAKSYSPDSWSDVTISRWLSLDDIEERYGEKARIKAQAWATGNRVDDDDDHGDNDGDGVERNKFGNDNGGRSGIADGIKSERGLIKLRVVDRQRFVYELSEVIVSPDTGDVRVIEGLEEERIADLLANGGIRTRRMAKRVKWTVCTYETLIFDDYSPYPWLTVVPFFAYFRRGRTRGMVDNAMGPQDALNKSVSQFIHIINTAANSGWTVEESSLTNMTTTDLEGEGAKNGLVVEFKKGSERPTKIQPTAMPAGLDRLIERITVFLKSQTTPDAMRGTDEEEVSGVARQAKTYAAQKQLAVVLDNLRRTRDMLSDRILWLVQRYYDDARVFRISKTDPQTGQKAVEEVAINTPDPATGALLNDLTLGEYGVIVNERPTQVTFENGEFEQAIKMREIGVPIPDDVVVRNSSLADKEEVLTRMSQSTGKADPVAEAQAALIKAQTAKADAEATSKKVETMFSAINTAQVIAQTPATAPLADDLLKSAGYIDANGAPIVPEPPAGLPSIALPHNTDPRTPLNPTNPDVGVNAGIETGIAA